MPPFAPIAAAVLLLATTPTVALDLTELPELPSELADTLEPTATRAWLRDHVRADGATAHAPPECESVERFVGQITYPRTVCVPPEELSHVTGFDPGSTGGAPPQFHRLSRVRGRELRQTMACVTHGGPWLAEMRKETRCSGLVEWSVVPFGGGHSFPPFEWLDDQPPPSTLNWLYDPAVAGQESRPCPGSKSQCGTDWDPGTP